LLEVIMAVAILALVGLSIYRFLELNLRAIQFSTERGSESVAMDALLATLQAELRSLPLAQTQPGAIIGEAHKFNNLPADELYWITAKGNGLFTSHADADFRVTLRLRPEPPARLPTLGLRRVQIGGDPNVQNWLPLMPNVRALEFRYFDLRVNSWVEKWVDQQARPALVRVRIWRNDDVDPVEAILSLPRMAGASRPGSGVRRIPGGATPRQGAPLPRTPGQEENQ
jgi:hypothetical protein